MPGIFFEFVYFLSTESKIIWLVCTFEKKIFGFKSPKFQNQRPTPKGFETFFSHSLSHQATLRPTIGL
jgi:hypothetical protein